MDGNLLLLMGPRPVALEMLDDHLGWMEGGDRILTDVRMT